MTNWNIFKVLVDIGMIVGPVIGYIYQCSLIRRSKSLGTFSIDICGILLLANILRINFYFFKPYEQALLFQSFLMIIVQMFLLKLCKSIPNNKSNKQPPAQSNKFSIWRWPHFSQYLLFILGFIMVLAVLTIVIWKKQISNYYGEVVGLVALSSQSILILPQIIKNYKSQKVKGVSHMLLSLNLIGDILKLCYFIIQKQPFQFIMCGVTQVILDTFVITQIFYYRKNRLSQKQTTQNNQNNMKELETNSQRIQKTNEECDPEIYQQVETTDQLGAETHTT